MNFYQLYAERSNKRWQATNRSTRIVDERMHLLKCNSFRADGSKPWDVPSLTNLLQNCRLFLSIFFRCKKEACTGRPFRGKYLGTVKVKRENEPLTGHNTTEDQIQGTIFFAESESEAGNNQIVTCKQTNN